MLIVTVDAAAGGVLSELVGIFFFFGIKEKTKTDAKGFSQWKRCSLLYF